MCLYVYDVKTTYFITYVQKWSTIVYNGYYHR